MKTPLFLSVITFIVGLVVGYLCFGKTPPTHDEKFDISQYANVKPDTTNKRSGQLSVDSAYEMVQLYKGLDPDLKQNTRVIWFPFSRIESLYLRMKAEQEAGMGTDGLRIYLAKYPKEYAPGKKHPHANQNTLVLVSTKDSLKRFHRDYYYDKLLRESPENKGELCPPGDCPFNGALLLTPPKK